MPAPRSNNRGGGENLKRKLQGDNPTSPKTVQFEDLTAEGDITKLISLVIEDGGALVFSRTQDGGAIVLGFLLGDERPKRYITSRADWESLIAELSS
jgi:hypothetical protein